jgi:membrane protease YdiL (CAAX protease family)
METDRSSLEVGASGPVAGRVSRPVNGLVVNGAPPSVASSVVLLLAVWSLLLAGWAPSLWLGPEVALLLSFGVATALVLWRRARGDRPRPTATRRVGALSLTLGLAAGYLSFPAWVSLVSGIGLRIGLEPLPARAPGAGGAALWLAAVVLAPLFEEILYREHLLSSLRAAAGPLPALALSTLAFAISHLEAWSVLATACVGLVLGVVALVGRSVWLCVALHAGLNLASMLQGAPPVRLAPPAAVGAVGGGGLLLAALYLCRPRLAENSPEQARRYEAPNRTRTRARARTRARSP